MIPIILSAQEHKSCYQDKGGESGVKDAEKLTGWEFINSYIVLRHDFSVRNQSVEKWKW